MNRLMQLSFAGLVIAAGAFAQSSASWLEQWHKAKFGRSSALYEARQKADQPVTAYREERALKARHEDAVNNEGISWREQWFKAKFGRYSPAEEARQRGEQVETAYREERVSSAPYRTNESREQWYKGKFGRFSSMEEARRRGVN